MPINTAPRMMKPSRIALAPLDLDHKPSETFGDGENSHLYRRNEYAECSKSCEEASDDESHFSHFLLDLQIHAGKHHEQAAEDQGVHGRNREEDEEGYQGD